MKLATWTGIILISLAAWWLWGDSDAAPRAHSSAAAAPAAKPEPQSRVTTTRMAVPTADHAIAPAPTADVQTIARRLDESWERTDAIVRRTLTACYAEAKSMKFCREVFIELMLKECEDGGRGRAECLGATKFYCANPRADRDFCERE